MDGVYLEWSSRTGGEEDPQEQIAGQEFSVRRCPFYPEEGKGGTPCIEMDGSWYGRNRLNVFWQLQ